MRFVALKTEEQQARAMLFRTRQMFVGQRTQMIDALRRHLAEHGLFAATGTAQLKRLADAIGDSRTLPEGVRDLGQMYLAQIEGLNARVAELDQKMRTAAKEAAKAILKDHGEPTSRYDFFETLTNSGVIIHGQNPPRYARNDAVANAGSHRASKRSRLLAERGRIHGGRLRGGADNEGGDLP